MFVCLFYLLLLLNVIVHWSAVRESSVHTWNCRTVSQIQGHLKCPRFNISALSARTVNIILLRALDLELTRDLHKITSTFTDPWRPKLIHGFPALTLQLGKQYNSVQTYQSNEQLNVKRFVFPTYCWIHDFHSSQELSARSHKSINMRRIYLVVQCVK